VDLIDSISIYASKTLRRAKPSAQKRKTRHYDRVFSPIQKNLAMVMTMMTTMMMGRGVGRNHRPSQNDERDGSKKQRAQLHDRAPSQTGHSFKWSVCQLQPIPATNFSHHQFAVMFQA
jgi:hypothetical protein